MAAKMGRIGADRLTRLYVQRSLRIVVTSLSTAAQTREFSMKKRTLIFSAAAILIVVLAVPLAVAEHMRAAGFGHGCRRGGSSMMMFGHMRGAKAALGLSDQQAADIKKIFTDLRA